MYTAKGTGVKEMYPEDPRGAGIGPLHSEHTPSPFTVPEVPIGGSVYRQPGTKVDRSCHSKEGFQVSKGE
jgi:hypothetical protein